MTKVTEVSRKEMRDFVSWLNEKKGYHPTIIGGWAVDYYNDYFGSKDIDIVFDNDRKLAHRIADEYCLANGYMHVKKDVLGIQRDFRKKLETDEGSMEIDIDTCTTRDDVPFHADNSKRLPFSLVRQEYEELKEKINGKTIFYRVPKIELLLLFKIKAYHDRDYDARQTADPQQVNYFSSKRDKDGADIIALLDKQYSRRQAEIDYGKLNQIIIKFCIETEVSSVLNKIRTNPAAIGLYQRNRAGVQETLIQELLQNAVKHVPATKQKDV